MNKIEAIIRPEKLASVTDALERVGMVGINVAHITGRGDQREWRTGNRGTMSYEVRILPRVKLELVVKDADTLLAVGTIMSNARTGYVGDGKIFVTPVAEALCIRTGEQGNQALQHGVELQPFDRPVASPDLVSVPR